MFENRDGSPYITTQWFFFPEETVIFRPSVDWVLVLWFVNSFVMMSMLIDDCSASPHAETSRRRQRYEAA